MGDAKLIVRATNIWTMMGASAYFPTPIPSLSVLRDAIDAFAAAVAEAETGGTYQKAVKNEMKAQLALLLQTLGSYVLLTAEGQLIIAQSSGFTIAKAPSPQPPVQAATNQKLEDGANAGELVYSFDKVKGAKGYIYQYTADPLTEASTWQSQVGTVRKAFFEGLESGKKYWCRVMAIGTNGQGVYSEPISRIVQ